MRLTRVHHRCLTDLSQVAQAGGHPRRLPRTRERGQQDAYEHRDNANDNQQFHQRESAQSCGRSGWHSGFRLRRFKPHENKTNLVFDFAQKYCFFAQ
jgi:hypothetical protein